MIEIILDYVGQAWEPFIDPRKRVFFGYLGSALIIAILLYFIQALRNKMRTSFLSVLKDLFSKRVWFARSAVADYKILFISRFIMFSIAPHLISTLTLTTIIFESLHILFDGRVLVSEALPTWIVIGLFSTTLFLLDDWSKYIVHKALHKIPILWCFHKVHHTAEVLTPITVYRTHPVEALIFSIRSLVSKSIVLAIFVYFFGSQVELFSVLGVSVFLFLFNALGSNLRHSHVWLSYGRKIERFLISPAQHQVHHSHLPQHTDRNFGAVLAVWDWMGGSLHTTIGKKERISFGVIGESSNPHTMRYIFLVPFKEASLIIINYIPRFFYNFLFRRQSTVHQNKRRNVNV